mgnify:CR=1 FL=1
MKALNFRFAAASQLVKVLSPHRPLGQRKGNDTTPEIIRQGEKRVFVSKVPRGDLRGVSGGFGPPVRGIYSPSVDSSMGAFLRYPRPDQGARSHAHETVSRRRRGRSLGPPKLCGAAHRPGDRMLSIRDPVFGLAHPILDVPTSRRYTLPVRSAF